MTDKRISEANDYIAQAEKRSHWYGFGIAIQKLWWSRGYHPFPAIREHGLKTSFFKWQPDFDSAADAYQKAGVCLRNAKKFREAKDVYVKAAEAHRSNRAYYHAAKNYEQAALLLKEQKEFEEAVHLMQIASKLYREHGTPDTAAMTLEKTAKFMEPVKVDVAISLYLEAVDVVMTEDRPRQAVQSMAAAARLLVRQGQYDKAIELIQKERDLHFESENWGAVHRAVLFLVLVHLARTDSVAADKVLGASLRYEGFTASEFGQAIEQLLRAIDEQDGDQTSAILSAPLFKYLDNDYAKLAKNLAAQYGGGTSNESRPTNQEIGEEEQGDDGELDLR